jgi:predicted DNA-binding mobile mystery protein A
VKTNRKRFTLIEERTLAQLQNANNGESNNPPFNEWIRLLRKYFRMTQSELAERAQIPQSHIVKIEGGKADVQISTLEKIFKAMSCDLIIQPKPQKPIEDILRGRARAIALRRLKQSMGTMALEGQAAEANTFRELLEKKTDEILSDPREKLWNKN